MHPFLEKIEQYNSKLIIPAVLVLLVVVIFELFVHVESNTVHLIVQILDYLAIAVFVIDLVFLAHRAKSTAYFFKNYWLDILAVFPFALFFRVTSRIFEAFIATERIAVGQAVLHEGLEARRGFQALQRAGRFTRVAARLIRIVTKSHLFTIFSQKHHQSAKNRKTGRNMRQEMGRKK